MINNSKYEPLWKYISDNDIKELTFEKIKELLGFDIDHSFLRYKKDLLNYGYFIKKIYLKNKKIVFEKENNNGK